MISAKSEVFDMFKQFQAQIERLTNQKIRHLRSDGGGEYCSNNFQQYLKNEGIIHIITAPHTPQDNGGAERKNRTLMEMARTLRLHANLPPTFWNEAIRTACYLRNRITTTAKTPYEWIYGQKPSLQHLRPFGCSAWRHIPKANRNKLDSKSEKCLMLGYEPGSRNYRLLTKDWKIVKSRDVFFEEKQFPRVTGLAKELESQEDSSEDEETDIMESDEDSSDTAVPRTANDIRDRAPLQDDEMELEDLDEDAREPQIEILEDEDVFQTPQEGTRDAYGTIRTARKIHLDRNIPAPPQPLLRRSARNTKHPGNWWESASYHHALVGEIRYALAVGDDVHSRIEPASYQEAIRCADKNKWTAAMDEEIASLHSNNVWELVELPRDAKPITCKWVYKIKYNTDRSIDRYKARLVVRGFTQKEGIDFNETFAPVAKYSSLRILFARATALGQKVLQLDIKTAFLYGELDETIYMRQPDGYAAAGQEGMVCKLKRSLYGLKQAPRQWNIRINTYLMELGFVQLHSDHCVYRHDGTGVLLLLWVDDILLFGSEKDNYKFYKKLAAQFAVKLIGDPARVVGLEVIRYPGTTILHQRLYAEDILKRFGMQHCKPVGSPVSDIDPNSPPLSKDKPYMNLVGSIMFLMVGTRPDLAFAVNILSRALHAPTESHWDCGKRILRYIAGTLDVGIRFKGEDFPRMAVYSDSDWASDAGDRKSITGMLAMFCGGPISWICRKQATVALSSTEAEYQALTEATKETLWLRLYLEELGHIQQQPSVILGDNQGSHALAKNPVHHARTKHVHVKFHFIRQHIEELRITINYIPTGEMLADLLTKGLAPPKTKYLREKMGLARIQALKED